MSRKEVFFLNVVASALAATVGPVDPATAFGWAFGGGFTLVVHWFFRKAGQ